MSRFVAALVYRKRIGSMARKSILAYCAERANDDGSGIWASKVRIANEVECSKQTVISTLNVFVEEGIMVEVGKRKSPHGYTVEYAINIALVMALPDAFEDPFATGETRGPKLDGSNELTPRGQTVGPQEVKPVDPNRPRTVLKPSNARERSDDLFSAESEADQQAETPDQDFDRFWAVYPKKAGKIAARKAWAKAIKQETPTRIIAAAHQYANWLANAAPGEFRPLPKNPQGWLNDGRWDEFSARQLDFRWDDLRPAQQNALSEGRCPPSMLENGKPNAVAAYWLAQHRGAAE